MKRDMVSAPGLTVVWPVSGAPSGASSVAGIARRLDRAQERLDVIEASLATLAPHTGPIEHHEQELREIRLLVADLTAEVLGADHPLVAQLQRARLSHAGQRGVVAPAESPRGSWAGACVHRLFHRLVSILLSSSFLQLFAAPELRSGPFLV